MEDSKEIRPISPDAINRAYGQLRGACDWVHAASELAIRAKSEAEKLTLRGLADGTITGQTPAMREASAREVLEKEYITLEMAEKALRSAKYAFDKANIEIARVRAQLRMTELLCRSPGYGGG